MTQEERDEEDRQNIELAELEREIAKYRAEVEASRSR